MKDFKKLQTWEISHKLTLSIYSTTKNFPKEETYGIISQLRRSSASIPANIAEGCGRNTDLDFARHLHIALGSLHETEYFIILSKDLNYISDSEVNIIIETINLLKGKLISLIKKIKSNVL